jgi:hypothetical protein
LAAQLAAADNGDDVVQPPMLIELPVGTAARIRSRTAPGMAASDGTEPLVDGVRFFVPVAAWDLMLVLAFSTPSLPASDAFADLFDLLAQTARWVQAA